MSSVKGDRQVRLIMDCETTELKSVYNEKLKIVMKMSLKDLQTYYSPKAHAESVV